MGLIDTIKFSKNSEIENIGLLTVVKISRFSNGIGWFYLTRYKIKSQWGRIVWAKNQTKQKSADSSQGGDGTKASVGDGPVGGGGWVGSWRGGTRQGARSQPSACPTGPWLASAMPHGEGKSFTGLKGAAMAKHCNQWQNNVRSL